MKRSTFNSTIDAASQDGSAAGIVGHGLLSEVLKMQGLLEEYQHALTALEIEKADKQQEINKLDRLLKGKGQTEGTAFPLAFFQHTGLIGCFFFERC